MEWTVDVLDVADEVSEMLAAMSHMVSPDDKHWLVVEDLRPYWESVDPTWDGVYEPDSDRFETYIEHPEECAHYVWGSPKCGVAYQEDMRGLDDLLNELDEGECGRWEIEYWFEHYPAGPWGGPEADTGLAFVDGDIHANSCKVDVG